MTVDREQIRLLLDAVEKDGTIEEFDGAMIDLAEWAAENLRPLLAELEQAEQTALDWQAACEESQASESDLMKELTESKKLYEYAQSYRSETEKKLEQAERERDEAREEREIHRRAADTAEEWMVPFDGSGIEWHESLPSPYTYQESDFNKLVVAVHQYEARALAAESRLAAVPALVELLRRVEPELVPHHDAAQALSDKFGLGRVGKTRLVEDIRDALSAFEDCQADVDGHLPEGLRAEVTVDREQVRRDIERELTCERCGLHHGVVWFAPSDVWNAIMRDGERGNPDAYAFCCPVCFISLAEAAGVQTTGWLVTPFDDGPVERADQVVLSGRVKGKLRGGQAGAWHMTEAPASTNAGQHTADCPGCAIERLEAQLAKVPALVEALRQIAADVPLMREPRDAWNVAREALAAYEQAQEPK